MHEYQFKLVKLQGDFIWHDHHETDETFIVMEGNLRIDFRDGENVRNAKRRGAQALCGKGGQVPSD